MTDKKYTPQEVAVLVLKKAEELTKSAIAGLQSTKLTPVPGVVSPKNSNTATPHKVGSQAVVKTPKSKKMGQATDKPSQFYKNEENQSVNMNGVQKLKTFLQNTKSKKGL